MQYGIPTSFSTESRTASAFADGNFLSEMYCALFLVRFGFHQECSLIYRQKWTRMDWRGISE